MSTAFSRLTTFNHILMTVNGQGYTVYVNGVAHGGSTSILNGMPLVGTSSGTLSIILPAGSNVGTGGGGVYNDMQLYTADLSVYGVNLYNGGGPSLFCLPPALPTASTPAATSLSWVGGPTNVACSDLIANYRYLGGPGPTVSTSNTGSAGAAAATSTATWDSVNYGVGITTTSASFLSPAISFTSNVAGIGFWLRHSSATLQPMVTLGGGLRMWAGAYGACITNATGSTSSSTSCTGLQSYAYTLTGFPMRYSSNNVWNHFLFTATSGNVFTLFINGVVAGRSTTGAYSTYFTGSTTVGFAAPGYSSGNIVVFADLQIYNANDLSTAGGNLYNSYACNSPTSQNITMTAATPVSMYSSSPYAAGPPFENSCPDTQPWHRIVGNSSSYATTASDLVNTGSCTTPATASGVAWSSTYGGLLINGSAQTLALPPTLFVNQGAVTIAAWINHNVGATWTPALVLGNGLYLYVSSTYGVCVTSGSVLGSGTNACNTYWSYSLANTPVPAIYSAWTHFVFVATNTAGGTYSLYQNGILVQTGVSGAGATTLFPWNTYYGYNFVQIGATGSYGMGPLTIGDLQVYPVDFGVTAPNLFFGGDCLPATTMTLGTQSATTTRNYTQWVSSGLGTTSDLSTSYSTSVFFNEWPPGALSGASSTVSSTYGSGTYAATASSTTANAWYVFDKSSATTVWTSANAWVYTSVGIYIGASATSGQPSGEWVQIQSPVAFVLAGYTLTANPTASITSTPYSWIMTGSNDGITYVALDTRTAVTIAAGTAQEFGVSLPVYSAYLYYRFIVTATQVTGTAGNATAVAIPELKLYSRDAPPESQTCSDVLPTNRIIGGVVSGSAALANEVATTGTQAGVGTIQSRGSNVTAVGNGISFTGAPANSFARTLPTIYTSGVTASMWFKAAAMTTTWSAVAQLGANGLYLYVSSYGLCVVQSSYTLTTTGGNSCSALAGTNGTYLNAAPFLGTYTYGSQQVSGFAFSQWHHVVFTASPSLGYNLFVDGLLAQGSFSGTLGSTELPPVPMTAASTPVSILAQNATYINVVPPNAAASTVLPLLYGSYAATASTTGTGVAYLAFDKAIGSSWASSATAYNAGGSYAGANTVPGMGQGEWLRIQLPNAMRPVSYTLTADASAFLNAPATWRMAGSNDNNTWTTVHLSTAGNTTFSASQSITFTVNTQSSFIYYTLLIFTTKGASTGAAVVAEWRLNTVPMWSDNGYSLYHGNKLAVPLGFYTPIALPAGAAFLAGDFQTYTTDYSPANGAASLYWGGNCSTGGLASSLSGTYAPWLDVAHRYLAGAGITSVPNSNYSTMGPGDVPDLVGSYSAVSANTTWSSAGLGVVLQGGTYATLTASGGAPIDWGALANSGTGFSASFWVYRTVAPSVAGVITRLVQFTGASSNANVANSFSISLVSQTTNGVLGYLLALTWPGCGQAAANSPGVYYAAPTLSGAGIGNSSVMPVLAMHNIIVSFSSNTNVHVYVDGVEWAMMSISNTASLQECTLGNSEWPDYFPTSGSYLGDYGGSVETVPTFLLVDAAFWTRPLSTSEVSAAVGTSVFGTAVASPPPPPFVAQSMTMHDRLVRCSQNPPSHRYGSGGAYPFVSGMVYDQNATGYWNVPYSSSLPSSALGATAANSPIAFPYGGNAGSLYTLNAALDFGMRTFSGSGLSIMWLTTNANGQCNTTQQNANGAYNSPTSLTYFDFGGYTLYVNGSCSVGAATAGGTTTFMSGPSATASFIGGGTFRSPVVPAIDMKYTLVSIGSTGTYIYVDGYIWASFPSVVWSYSSSNPFISSNTRFFGGNMLATSAYPLTIHDLQIYDYALTAVHASALANGRGGAC